MGTRLIEFTGKGLFCPAGNFYIDPWSPVEKAVITHAHSDHARAGHQQYLCQTFSKPLLQLRLGNDISIQALPYNESLFLNGVKISFHPAGHIIGSAQVRVAYKGQVWVISGDYKPEHDGISTPFEVVRCHTFITESTFGLPIYNWQPQMVLLNQIRRWITLNLEAGRNSVLLAYSLGKAQRILHHLQKDDIPFYVHGAIDSIHSVLLQEGWPLPEVKKITESVSRQELLRGLIIAPPSAAGSPWLKKFHPYSLGICSGWMQVRGNTRRSNADVGFALSDHADWNGLLNTIKATGAEKVYVTHGFSSVLARYLTETGIPAEEVKTVYGEEQV
jgi:putative mRNA 3-end processing factor